VFQSGRWDQAASITPAELAFDLPVTAGEYEVRLYFAEVASGRQFVGGRVFDVSIEGALALNDYDIYADVGGYTGVVKTFTVTSNSNLDIDFGHVGNENPIVSGVEIIRR
jgi:hypothetical protein